MRRIENACRELAQIQGLAYEIQAALTVTEMQMHDTGLAGDHPRDVSVARNSQQLVPGRLARAVIGERELADADDRIEIDDVVADAAGQGHRGHVITAGVTPRAEPFVTKGASLGQQ